MKNSKIIILIFFILKSNIVPQEILQLGFRTEIGYINYKIGDTTKEQLFIIPIQNISFTLDLKLNKELSFQVRPGLMLTNYNYEGFEFGSFIFYNLPFPKLYSNLGVNYHFNSNIEGNSGGTGRTASFIIFGIGYNFTNNFSLELSDQFPIKGNYGFFFYNSSYFNYKINNILKLGLAIKI